MKDWLGKGVGALRVDTVKHMSLWFWQEWVTDLCEHTPGLFLVGEWFLGGCYDPASVEFANRSGMTIFDFALQRALEEALARSLYEGFSLVHNVFERDSAFSRATHLVTFVDNHDMPRFLSVGGTDKRLELAANLIQLNGYASAFGERVAIVGNVPELGAWDLAGAPVLHYVNPNLWEGDVCFGESAGKVVRYKFVVLREGCEPNYELSRPRKLYVHKEGSELRTDRWNS